MSPPSSSATKNRWTQHMCFIYSTLTTLHYLSKYKTYTMTPPPRRSLDSYTTVATAGERSTKTGCLLAPRAYLPHSPTTATTTTAWHRRLTTPKRVSCVVRKKRIMWNCAHQFNSIWVRNFCTPTGFVGASRSAHDDNDVQKQSSRLPLPRPISSSCRESIRTPYESIRTPPNQLEQRCALSTNQYYEYMHI